MYFVAQNSFSINVVPARQLRAVGKNANFRCDVQLEKGTYYIDWAFNDDPIPINAVLSEDNSELRLKNLQYYNSGKYTCLVQRINGETSSDNANLKVFSK